MSFDVTSVKDRPLTYHYYCIDADHAFKYGTSIVLNALNPTHYCTSVPTALPCSETDNLEVCSTNTDREVLIKRSKQPLVISVAVPTWPRWLLLARRTKERERKIVNKALWRRFCPLGVLFDSLISTSRYHPASATNLANKLAGFQHTLNEGLVGAVDTRHGQYFVCGPV